jgi:hypothetical protein
VGGGTSPGPALRVCVLSDCAVRHVHLPSARKLLEDLAATFGKDIDGTTDVPTGQDAYNLDGMRLVRLGYQRKVRIQSTCFWMRWTGPSRHDMVAARPVC